MYSYFDNNNYFEKWNKSRNCVKTYNMHKVITEKALEYLNYLSYAYYQFPPTRIFYNEDLETLFIERRVGYDIFEIEIRVSDVEMWLIENNKVLSVEKINGPSEVSWVKK